MLRNSLLLLLLFACSKESVPPVKEPLGCQSGVVAGVRTTYRCATQLQFAAGDNVKSGGTKLFDFYTDSQWELCNECK